MRASVLKSGKPCAKFTARSGLFNWRFRRVISRMTDSVKLWTLNERRFTGVPAKSRRILCLRGVFSVLRSGTLQVEIRTRAGVASLGLLETALPPPAHVTGPARLGEELEHVGAAEQTDHLAALDHRHQPDPLADEQARVFIDAGVLVDGDHARAHDVAGHLALFREHIGLGDDADHVSFCGHDGGARDPLGREGQRDLVEWRVLAKCDHVPRHDLFDRDHQCRSSVATVSGLAWPPLRITPAEPFGSFPDRCAASGRAPVGSSARCIRDQATRTAEAISSSVTVTISSTRLLANMVSNVRTPIEVVRTPSARVAGAAARDWMLPAFQLW